MPKREVSSVFNEETLRQLVFILPIYIAEAAFSFFYVKKFLVPKYSLWLVLTGWCVPQVFLDGLLFIQFDNSFPFFDLIRIAERLAVLLILQFLLFHRREYGMHIFLSVSTIAVVFLLRYFTSIPYATASDLLWGHIMPFLLNRNLLDAWTTDPVVANIYMQWINNIFLMFTTSVWGVLILALIFRMLAKAYRLPQEHIDRSDAVFLCVPPISAILISVALRAVLMLDIKNNRMLIFNEYLPLRIAFLLICVFLILTVYITVILFQQQLLRREDARLAAMQEAHVQKLTDEIADLNSIYGDLRLLRHDLNNHIENLSALYTSDAPESEIFSYLERMKQVSDRLSYTGTTGHPVCDIILHRKEQLAKAEGIAFTEDFHFPTTNCIDAYDVGVILDNALDNAIRAGKERDLEQRFISIRSFEKGHLFFIQIENSFTGSVTTNAATGLPQTTKTDPTRHGLGLVAIKQTAEKYYGNIKIETSKIDEVPVFTLTVMIRNDR